MNEPNNLSEVYKECMDDLLAGLEVVEQQLGRHRVEPLGALAFLGALDESFVPAAPSRYGNMIGVLQQRVVRVEQETQRTVRWLDLPEIAAQPVDYAEVQQSKNVQSQGTS